MRYFLLAGLALSLLMMSIGWFVVVRFLVECL